MSSRIFFPFHHTLLDVVTGATANSYVEDRDLAINNNLTCNGMWPISRTLRCGINKNLGGAQSYCCSGFVPSQISNTDSLWLLGGYRPVDEDQKELSVRVKLITDDPNRLTCGAGLIGGQEAENNNYQILRYVSEIVNSAHSKVSVSEYGTVQQTLCC